MSSFQLIHTEDGGRNVSRNILTVQHAAKSKESKSTFLKVTLTRHFLRRQSPSVAGCTSFSGASSTVAFKIANRMPTQYTDDISGCSSGCRALSTW
jgi:hypothetical protein